jgi:hypothetical protein
MPARPTSPPAAPFVSSPGPLEPCVPCEGTGTRLERTGKTWYSSPPPGLSQTRVVRHHETAWDTCRWCKGQRSVPPHVNAAWSYFRENELRSDDMGRRLAARFLLSRFKLPAVSGIVLLVGGVLLSQAGSRGAADWGIGLAMAGAALAFFGLLPIVSSALCLLVTCVGLGVIPFGFAPQIAAVVASFALLAGSTYLVSRRLQRDPTAAIPQLDWDDPTRFIETYRLRHQGKA